MKRALPVAVKLLHKGNRELSRNMASYLSLAVIHNAPLLSQHIQLIIDSVISGEKYSMWLTLRERERGEKGWEVLFSQCFIVIL